MRRVVSCCGGIQRVANWCSHTTIRRTSSSTNSSTTTGAASSPVQSSSGESYAQLALLQQQVAGLEATRGRLSAELVHASSAVEAAAAAQAESLQLRQQLADMQSQHAACIELLGMVAARLHWLTHACPGEKEEALEETLADLEDVKQVVKQQVLLITECIQRGAMSPDALKFS